MLSLLEHLKTRPRMLIATAAGIVAGTLAPDLHSPVTRLLVGWNTGVWLLLVLLAQMMLASDHERLRRLAVARAEGAATVLGLVIVAAIASIVAIVFELAAAKGGGRHALPHVVFALVTVAGSWLLLPTLFAMNYASLHYSAAEHGHGLTFPTAEPRFHPDYADFLYFSFTIAVASQTADVAISTRPMRRLVLLQSVLSFLFNTAILAFSINMAASLF